MKKLIVLAGLLLTALTSFAGTYQMYFGGFSPIWQTGYPYYASVNGGPTIDVMCDDWVHGGLPGQTWDANFTDLGSGSLSVLRFNTLPNAATLYKEAGWLLLETQVVNSNQYTAINQAVWYTFDPDPLIITDPNTPYWLNAAQTEAANGFPGVNFNRVGIYTPVNQYDSNPEGPQELLTIVPEPGTLLLIGGGLLGILGRRKFR